MAVTQSDQQRILSTCVSAQRKDREIAAGQRAYLAGERVLRCCRTARRCRVSAPCWSRQSQRRGQRAVPGQRVVALFGDEMDADVVGSRVEVAGELRGD